MWLPENLPSHVIYTVFPLESFPLEYIGGRGWGEGTLQSILHKLLGLCSMQLKPFHFSFAHHTCPLPGYQSLLKTSSIIVFPFFLGPPHFFSARGKPLTALHCNPALPSRGLSSKFGVFIFTFGNGKAPKPQYAGPQLKLSDSSWPSVPTPVVTTPITLLSR